MRQDGRGTITLEDARIWIEETGLCLFLPKRQSSSAVAPSFVEAVAGRRDTTPGREHIALAEELLVRLETDGVAVRLNLQGLPGEQPDYVVASWVLPYVYALRGDRDWRRSPQLTGSRQVSPLAIQTYKLLEAADTTASELAHTLGREVTEVAVLRAIAELWQQLRIIPVISVPGKSAKWQLLRQRFQKAIAEGASTSQVTAISVLASIYLQAVIAATMEDVEVFLSSLTARSKVREVLRGLMATRQVHTIALGHSTLFYVAGTLPEFSVAPSINASASLPPSANFMRLPDEDVVEFLGAEDTLVEQIPEPVAAMAVAVDDGAAPISPMADSLSMHLPEDDPTPKKPAISGKAPATRPHFSRPAPLARDRKPMQTASGSHPARRAATDSRPLPAGRSAVSRSLNAGSSNSRNSGPARGNRVPTLSAGTKAGNNKRYGFVARPKQGSKKRG
jgi:hypothetical protein